MEYSKGGCDSGGIAARKSTDYNKAAVYLKQIIHSIECAGKISPPSFIPLLTNSLSLSLISHFLTVIIHSLPSITHSTHSNSLTHNQYLPYTHLFILYLGGCKSTMCKQTTSILMHCNSCYDEFCMVSGCTTTKKLLIHTKTCFIFHSLLRNRLSKRYCFSHSITC